MVKKAKKKPVVIEFIQYNGNTNRDEICEWIGKDLKTEVFSDSAYEDYNDKVVTGTMVKSAVQNFTGKSCAILIHTTAMEKGVKTYNKPVIEKGVFKTFLHNQETAAYFNEKSTGNGYKTGLFGKVTVATNNFALEPGDKSFDELVELVDNGVYLTHVAGIHAGVNPISGSFSLQASGFMIENKQITKPITLFVVSGNFFNLLQNIEYIGNDFEYGLSQIGSASVVVKLDIAS